MTKQSEEGEIWEWRAFGRIGESLASKVYAYPIRLGLTDIRGEDIYLVAPGSNQNVKLRLYGSGWVLKLKLLIETLPGAFEHYRESAELSHRFPVSPNALQDAARLLEVEPPKAALAIASLNEEAFLRALAESSPSVVETRVSKRRSQYQVANGWLELANATFPALKVQSLSIHSPDIEVVREMVTRLRPADEMEPMNYIEACRRWG
jgi:hypothetical protein